jgi:Ubiquitin-conjugating enzyme
MNRTSPSTFSVCHSRLCLQGPVGAGAQELAQRWVSRGWLAPVTELCACEYPTSGADQSYMPADHPFGFVARPQTLADGALPPLCWEPDCMVAAFAEASLFVSCGQVVVDVQRVVGSTDFMVWNCSFPGKKGTDWEGGTYPVTISFTANYPSKSPECQ